MADSARLPSVQAWPACPVEYHKWFRQVDAAISSGSSSAVNVAAIAADMSAIDARVTSLEAAGGAALTGPQSVQVSGSLASGAASVRLRGDQQAPGNAKYYGTGSTGTKGYHAHAVSTLADVDLTGLVADDVLRFNGTDWVRLPVSGFAATILDDADGPAVLNTLSAQPADATLTGLSGATPALPALTEYADDAAAAIGGLAVGDLYRTGSIIKLRVA